MIIIQWREHYSGEFMKGTFNTGLHADAFKPIHFKAGMVIDTTKIYRLIQV